MQAERQNTSGEIIEEFLNTAPKSVTPRDESGSYGAVDALEYRDAPPTSLRFTFALDRDRLRVDTL